MGVCEVENSMLFILDIIISLTQITGIILILRVLQQTPYYVRKLKILREKGQQERPVGREKGGKGGGF
jgi:hypothetical protein